MEKLIRVGDRVKTNYHPGEFNIIRTVTKIIKDSSYGGGYAVSVDGGEKCKCCGLTPDTYISLIGIKWVTLVERKIKRRY